MVLRDILTFERPYWVTIRQETLASPAPGEAMVKTVASGISAGTELLFYRGQVPAGMAVDSVFQHMDNAVTYPLAYGYTCAGQVVEVGDAAHTPWIGRMVFAFQPHASHFVETIDRLIVLPTSFPAEQATFLPNVETALNLVMDSTPLIGERVLVFGQGIVGLLMVLLLSRFPLSELVTIDGYAKRRAQSTIFGAHRTLAPDNLDAIRGYDPDLIIELSSNPDALNAAIRLAGFGARIVVGSWYGDKPATLPLGGPFHRNRVQLISSQVSTLDGRFTNRWTKTRRLQLALDLLPTLPLAALITHRLPLRQAPDAYAMLDQRPEEALQVIFTY
jgi:2-desacetyl-2-hydroxyethyl bacteriochlorophyllide A dehydrogenase